MAEAVAAQGTATVTVAEVLARAGTSDAEFKELFADREACLLAAFELALERAGARMVAAYEAESRWLDGIRAALAGFLRFLDEEPALGRLAVVHATGAGASVLRRRMEVLGVLATVVDPRACKPPPASASRRR